jgi:hypothetical protein
VRADLDTLVIALYVTLDELLGPRCGPGWRPKLTDAELICLAVAQVLLGSAPSGPGCAWPASGWATCSRICQRPRPTTAGWAGPLVAQAIQDIAVHTPSWCDQLRLGEREVVAALLDHERARLRPGLVILGDKGLPAVSSTSSSPSTAPGCCDPTALMSRVGWGRWAVSGSGLRAPSRPSRVSSGWNSTAAAPWPGSGSGSPSDCWRWPPGSGGTGRSARPTSAPWSPTTTDAPSTTQSEAIIQ